MSLSRFILPIITLVLGLVLGFLANELILPASFITQEAAQKPQIKPVTEEGLPISLEVLQNPIVYQWRGIVEGKLVSKDEHTFVIEDEGGNRITVTDLLPTGEVSGMVFHKRVESHLEEVPLDDIPIGTKLRGDFWIFKGGEDRPIGGAFQIIE